MGSLIGSCVGSAVCTACCAGCGSCTPKNNKFGKASRIPFLFLIVLSGLVAVFMALYGEDQLNLTFYKASVCKYTDGCEGNGSVYRISFCFFVFEAIHVLLVPFVNDFHWMFFPIKFLLYVVGVVLTFVISGGNDFFNGYANYFARYASILYLLIQILILIDWAWNINEWAQKKAEEYIESLNMEYEDRIENYTCFKNPFVCIPAVTSIVLYVGSFVLIGFFYAWYGSGDDCSLHQALISVTVVILVINFIASGCAGGGTFPIAAIMSTYAMFLLYSAMTAQKDCNKWYSESSASMWLGIAFTLLALCYSAMKADLLGGAVDMTGVSCFGLCPGYSNDEDENAALLKNVNNNDSNYNENAGLGDSNYDDAATEKDKKNETTLEVNDDKSGENENDKDKDGNNEEDEDDSPELTTKQKKQNTIYFHFILCLASCYLSMLFTDWGNSEGGISTTGEISAWANMGCQWVSMLLFWQSLFVFARERRMNNIED